MIAPLPRSTMPGITPCARPQAFTTRVIRKSRCRLHGTPAKLWAMEKPALLTSTSTWRPRAVTAASTVSQASHPARSAGMAKASIP